MNLQWLVVVATMIVVLLAIIGVIKRVRFWRRGQKMVTGWLGLLAAPKRFFVDVHHVVARDKYMANTHTATAGGFVASSLLIVLVNVFQLQHRWLAWALIIALLVMTGGSISVAARRMGNAPKKLSKGPWNRLPVSLLCFSLGFILFTLPATGLVPANLWQGPLLLVLLLIIAWGVCEMFLGLSWGGPMKHAFAGFLHLGFHPRPERFSGDHLSTDIKPLNLQADKLGVEKPTDFKWNQLLGFDACVQCGRCQEVCPAYAAGQPLNPKKFIQDMVVGFSDLQTDESYSGSPYPGKQVGNAVGAPDEMVVPDLVDSDTLWSCTTCRACVYECPMMIEHVDAIVDIRRFLTMEKGVTPIKGVELLEGLAATDNPNGADPKKRSNWAADLNVPLMADVGKTDVLFWAGDGAFEMRNQRTLRSVVKLLQRLDIDFAILGNEEKDSGDTARRLGDEAEYQRLAKANIDTLSRYSFNRIITADPHALQALKQEYGAFGGDYTVLHHSTFFAEQIALGNIQVEQKIKEKITYHDPCYLGRYNGEINAPRSILDSIGINVVEMERSGMKSRCCGGGGAAAITDIPGDKRIPDIRIEDARQTGADIVAVGCPQCAVMLEGVVEPRPEVKDIAELLLEATEPST